MCNVEHMIYSAHSAFIHIYKQHVSLTGTEQMRHKRRHTNNNNITSTSNWANARTLAFEWLFENRFGARHCVCVCEFVTLANSTILKPKLAKHAKCHM